METEDVKDARPAAFPKLDDEQLAAVAEFAACKTCGDGETLFAAGVRELEFHVIKSGEVKVSDESGGGRRALVVHGPREFTGDLADLTGRPT
jgi:thioredoxin reductase (NADPH)